VPSDAEIKDRLEALRGRIDRAAARSSRSPAGIRLIAVSKTFGVEHVRAAAAAGQVDFGENRVQEAASKIGQTSDLAIRWHLVGHLQSNKAQKAATSFAWIHSIDSAELLKRVDAAAQKAGSAPRLLVQADLAGEATKHGAEPGAVRPIFEQARACRAARVVGLMALPPLAADPEEARPYFRALRELRGRLEADGVDPVMLGELSMGMSHDFEVAISEGATMVRIGTLIFGARGA
jgi:PLP dependent protein